MFRRGTTKDKKDEAAAPIDEHEKDGEVEGLSRCHATCSCHLPPPPHSTTPYVAHLVPGKDGTKVFKAQYHGCATVTTIGPELVNDSISRIKQLQQQPIKVIIELSSTG